MPRGGRRIGAGRPKGTTGENKPAYKRHEIRKLYRWSQEEYELILQAVAKISETEAEFVRNSTLDAAKKIVKA